MKARDFCYWLQGYFEIDKNTVFPDSKGDRTEPLNSCQVQVIKNHLNMVFKHEIDPSNGTPEHNKELSKLHSSTASSLGMGTLAPLIVDPTTLFNC